MGFRCWFIAAAEGRGGDGIGNNLSPTARLLVGESQEAHIPQIIQGAGTELKRLCPFKLVS